jgi:hypothetical protein
MSQRSKFSLVLVSIIVLILIGGAALVWAYSNSSYQFVFDRSQQIAAVDSIATTTPVVPEVIHLSTPKPLKAIYMTQCIAASPKLRESLIKLADESEINAIVVDLKDYSGTVSFPSETALPGGKGCTVADFKDLVKSMHEKEIYVIGRLTVFQDPLYTRAYPDQAVQSISTGTPWKDRKGLSFVDVGARAYLVYIISLAQEAYDLGVDEINFDYIRYPSDGNMKDTKYITVVGSKAEMLERFFAALTSGVREAIKSKTGQVPVLSADLFGMTASNTDDLNIGQVLERTLPYFDYVYPMVYPSHYPPKFNGWADPNKHPYDIVKFSMERAVARAVAATTTTASLAYQRIGTSTPAVYEKPIYSKYKLRPWLQDFNYPVTYTPEMVKTQIQATYDAGLDSWLMWDPANTYTASVFDK